MVKAKISYRTILVKREPPSTDQCGGQSATQMAVKVDRDMVTEAFFMLAEVARIYILDTKLVDEVRIIRV